MLLAALAAVLRESVSALEATVAHISDIAMARDGRPDRALIVAFQDFDRLQQEFATLSDVLATLSVGSRQSDGALSQAVMAGITIADLKARISNQLEVLTAGAPDPATLVDVEF